MITLTRQREPMTENERELSRKILNAQAEVLVLQEAIAALTKTVREQGEVLREVWHARS